MRHKRSSIAAERFGFGMTASRKATTLEAAMTGRPKQASSPNDELPDFSDVPDVPSAPARKLELVQRLGAGARLGTARTRAEVRRRRLLALGVVVLWALAQVAALGVRFDFAKLSFAYVACTFLLPLALGSLGLAIAVQPGRLGLGARGGLLAGLVVLGPLSVIGTALLLPEPYAGGLTGDRVSLFLCGNLALGWAAVPIVAAAFALQGAFAAGAVWRSALVGVACGLGAAVAAQVRCPITGGAHIALAHGGVVVLSALLGALLLPRATKL
jgi:hypothetical protein